MPGRTFLRAVKLPAMAFSNAPETVDKSYVVPAATSRATV